MKTVISFLSYLIPVFLYGQNVGIGTSNPTEKLEVSGKIFTNQGGIVFPDQTIQTTAAFNATAESIAMPRGIGFIKFSPTELAGPLDTVGLNDVSIIYTSELSITNPGAGNTFFGPLHVTKLNDQNSNLLLKYIALQSPINNVWIYLTRETTTGLVVYYETKLTGVKIAELAPSMQPGTNGGFAHLDNIGLNYTTITFHDLDAGMCYCWNLQTATACSCP